MDIARYSGGLPARRGILLLDEPKVSESRIRAEWDSIQAIFRPEILNRLALVIHQKGAPDHIIGHLDRQEQDSISAIIEHGRQQAFSPKRRPSEAFFDILRLLVIHWFRNSGPLTSKALCAQSGFSYPTVAASLEQLERYLVRHSDRQVELRSFPKDAWFKLVSQAEKVRSSTGYADRSGKPRPPNILLERLRELGRDDIAVAGVLGARHYLPGLDLFGTPRLDLVVDAKNGRGSNEFLRRLDPALKPVADGEPAQVVIHTLYRPETCFKKAEKGELWADEVECLLDLHEMRLESQALEFVEHLTPKLKP
jgi:hypothetical protein